MSLIVGTNSYSTVAEADTYLTDRIGSAVVTWFTLNDTASPGVNSKESLLVSAYYWLTGSTELDLPRTSSDQNIKNAQIESALYLLEYYEALNKRRAEISQGVKSDKKSKVSTSYRDSIGAGIPDFIMGMISEYQTVNTFADLKGQYDV